MRTILKHLFVLFGWRPVTGFMPASATALSCSQLHSITCMQAHARGEISPQLTKTLPFHSDCISCRHLTAGLLPLKSSASAPLDSNSGANELHPVTPACSISWHETRFVQDFSLSLFLLCTRLAVCLTVSGELAPAPLLPQSLVERTRGWRVKGRRLSTGCAMG